jgi:hypothetical protein
MAPPDRRHLGLAAARHYSRMRSALVAVLAVLVLAPAALADTTSTDSPRDPSVAPSQDFSHVSTTIDPAAGTWSVAYTFYGPPSSSAWGNLYARLYTGVSQCADFQTQIAGFQQTPSIPGDATVNGSVLPPPDRMLRAAQSTSKTFDGNTITISMTDSSLVGAPATCVEAGITHRGFLDTVGPLVFPSAPPPPPPPPGTAPPPPLTVALKSTRLTASESGVVKVALKPFNQAANGVVTLREGGKQIGRASYKARSGAPVTVSIKLSSAARRSLKRHPSLLVTVTATAQAGTQMATKAVRARVRR